jgi:hypothetical protein
VTLLSNVLNGSGLFRHLKKKLPTDHPNWHWPHPIGGGFGYMPASGSGTLR